MQDKTPGKPSAIDTASLEGIPDRQRRLLLRAGLGMSLGASALLAACGGGDDAAPGTPPATSPGTGTGTTPGTGTGTTPSAKVSSFALAVLPDTQFYSRYATTDENLQFQRKYGSTPFMAQTKWITENAASLRIPFTIHLGDVVDQQAKPLQWQIASEAMEVMEAARAPYSILAGNHDVISDVDYVNAGSQASNTDAQRNLANEPYLKNFPTTRAQRQATFGGRDPSGFHEYHFFEVDGNRFMVLSMSWRASDAAITWARNVLKRYPKVPVILSTHQLLNIGPDGVSPLEVPYGLMLWDKLIKDNDQIFMTLNGHYHGAAHLTKTNDFGNPVEEMVVDYQMAYMGGNGLMRLYEFDLTHNKIKVISFSPWVPQKPTETLNEFDVAVLTDKNQQFEIDFDFRKRFARFNPDFAIPAAGNDPINDRAKAAILANYTEPSVADKKAAADTNDYPLVASTVAHWRFFGGANGAAVPVGQVINDMTGANPLSRAALADGGAAQLGDVTWSNDHHFLSAAPGSVKFANSVNSPTRMSFFATDTTAALNAMTFDNGYTVEAFIKVPASWTAGNNAWMNIMEREGRRGAVTGFGSGDADESPLIFAISSLREVQWEVTPSTAGTKNPAANWSGEIIAEKWVHVAVVNTPANNETVMYVEGAPVLRNASNTRGIATVGAASRFFVGGGVYANVPSNGFLGQIGEVRICTEPLAADKWLTARRT
ncbi:metallophosphoesterase [Cupriavidus sp. SZY C1]|uniref:LamG-like jellyroll fold domain-containing protein n=2 Tax=Pseudomonadota TaxID=1224 RepID=UPI0028B88CFC|nr:LamG-like jellyroll fold domain-containing protein [Cupriavidus sp. SZY C1]MDT6961367.1 metallophosphoesterase [Cupriavidus sp. SZY C1]